MGRFQEKKIGPKWPILGTFIFRLHIRLLSSNRFKKWPLFLIKICFSPIQQEKYQFLRILVVLKIRTPRAQKLSFVQKVPKLYVDCGKKFKIVILGVLFRKFRHQGFFPDAPHYELSRTYFTFFKTTTFFQTLLDTGAKKYKSKMGQSFLSPKIYPSILSTPAV